ncbi:hypothetical protein A2881_02110 [Candidatus Peribacteria bacterium RIFCSPHIGHO2_01_FULL_55_13]|nr:MAG: hypothetical protein A2881_02110 [Candidatus Peribacteria bacterium RIFCSPHIGHO2_01_FULL_55_13]OGJ65320.1 MAG: hypothetical protein A3F36_02105 [Candidatus Peribacteria bacterium RIFCSPHIGHO2_12_FULL_55_11]
MKFTFSLAAILILSACSLPTPQTSQPFDNAQDRPPQPSQETESEGEAPAEEQVMEPESLTGSLLPERLLSSGLLELGNRDAAHSMLLITEHHCNYCRDFLTEYMPMLEKQFLEAGTLRLAIAILPLKKYTGSKEMSSALYCAGKQNAGLGMHRLLFERTGSDRASLLSYAKELKLDEKIFGDCLGSEKTTTVIEEQQSWLRSLGVNLVPTYFIDGKQYTGLPYAADLEGQIREAMEK